LIQSTHTSMRSSFLLGVLALADPLSGAALGKPRIVISGSSNCRLTPPLRSFAEKKASKATAHYSSLLASLDVHLKVEHRGGGLHDTLHGGYNVHVAEAVATLRKDKRVLRVCTESDSMYATLDKLSDRLSRSLRKAKERKQSHRHAGVGVSALSEAVAGVAAADGAAEGAAVEASAEPRVPVDAEELLSSFRVEYLDELSDELLSQLRADDEEEEEMQMGPGHETPMSVWEAAEAVDARNSAHTFRIFSAGPGGVAAP